MTGQSTGKSVLYKIRYSEVKFEEITNLHMFNLFFFYAKRNPVRICTIPEDPWRSLTKRFTTNYQASNFDIATEKVFLF